MKATETHLLDVLESMKQFITPLYQRTYSWERSDCQKFWDDTLKAGRSKKIVSHFIGSIVYVQEGHFQISDIPSWLVIDGQQRLTTVTLIIEALARHLSSNPGHIEGWDAQQLRDIYLLNKRGKENEKYKLHLTQTDKESLKALVKQKELPDNYSNRLKENFEFFEQKIKELGDEVSALLAGLKKLTVVDISLEEGKDNAQLIFESMNAKGRGLSQTDLIRNFVLMDLERKQQEKLYHNHWSQMETVFGQQAYREQFDDFVRYYLTFKESKIPKKSEVYEEFKRYAASKNEEGAGGDDLVADLHQFAKYYCAMALPEKEENPLLRSAFKDLRAFGVDVAYPLLLKLYDDYDQGQLSDREFEEIVRLVESYVFRRFICDLHSGSLNKIFAACREALNNECDLENVSKYFVSLSSYRRFPDDAEFSKAIQLYNFGYQKRNRYCLIKLEGYGRSKEMVNTGACTIEHILPQNPQLASEWRQALGDSWQQEHKSWVNKLGNLTLSGYNSELSDRPFNKKRDLKGGYRESPLRLNQGLKEIPVWNVEAIKKRGNDLAQEAIRVWGRPHIPEKELEEYRQSLQPKKQKFSVANYSRLSEGSSTRHLFDLLRREILALDAAYVREEFLKSYIVYKAERTFVTIVPAARSIQISLTLSFLKMDDPRGLAEDKSEVAHLGTGDVQVKLTKRDDISYVMGLIEQAFEAQMEGDESD